MNKFGNINIMPIVALIAAPFVALWFGKLVANEDYIKLGGIAVGVVGLFIMGVAHKHLLMIGLVLATLDLWMAPTGFKTSAMEQGGAIAFAFWLLVFWRKDFNRNAPNAFKTLNSWGFFQTATIVACGYAMVHFLFNKWNPYEDLAFGFNGALKTYLQVYGPFLMIVATMNSRLVLPVNGKDSRLLLTGFAIAYGAILITRIIYVIRFGGGLDTPLGFTEKIEAAKAFHIPILNIYDNIYTHRTMGPVATLVGSTFLFCFRSKVRSLLPIIIVIMGLIGSAISGGRAALMFSAFFLILAAIHGGKKAEVLIGGFLIMFMTLIILITPADILRDLPWHAQRSIGILRSDLRTDATEGIKGSSDMRLRMFNYAWDYWINGDPRLLLSGRSVGEMQAQDMKSFEVSNDKEIMFFAIRRLGTHNGLTDMLIGWGLIGYILNLIVWVSCVNMLRRLNVLYERGSYGDCWSFIAMCFMAFWIVYTHIGGSFVLAISIWLTIVALSQTSGLKISIPHSAQLKKNASDEQRTLENQINMVAKRS